MSNSYLDYFVGLISSSGLNIVFSLAEYLTPTPMLDSSENLIPLTIPVHSQLNNLPENLSHVDKETDIDIEIGVKSYNSFDTN